MQRSLDALSNTLRGTTAARDRVKLGVGQLNRRKNCVLGHDVPLIGECDCAVVGRLLWEAPKHYLSGLLVRKGKKAGNINFR
jgi:hypothetical protein